MEKRAKSIKLVMGPLSWLDSERGKKRGEDMREEEGGEKRCPLRSSLLNTFSFYKKENRC